MLNEILLPAMKDVGDRFGRGELILPFVLQSAEVMKKAVAHLEQFLERRDGATKGTVVLATVFGDVHDIGKNLVHTILANNGYTVHDLGKQVPMNTILEKAVEVDADAIGLSALLVSTSKQMPICVEEQDARGLRFPVIVGGAAINRDFGRRIALLDDGARFFEPGLFYARDAFEGLDLIDALTGDAARRARVARAHQARGRLAQRERRRGAAAPAAATPLSLVKARARRRAAAAVLGRARRSIAIDLRERVAVLRSAQPLPSLVGRREHQRRRLRTARRGRVRAASATLSSAKRCASGLLAAARRLRLLSGCRPRRRRHLSTIRAIRAARSRV